MSKKIWNRIFKSKSAAKSAKTPPNKNNTRCSIYEEYQQLNALLSSDKSQQQQEQQPKLNAQNLYSSQNASTPTTTTTTATPPIVATATKTKESARTPTGTVVSDAAIPTIGAATTPASPTAATTPKPQSTFTKVVNTLTLKRSPQQPSQPLPQSPSQAQPQLPKESKSGSGNGNGGGTGSVGGGLALWSKSKSKSNQAKQAQCESLFGDTPTATTLTASSRRSSQILIVVNKIVCATVDVSDNDANRRTQSSETAEDPNKYPEMTETTEDIKDVLHLSPCPCCSRTFAPDTLKKHVTICEKNTTRRRKPFDSSRQRRTGTELASYVPPDHSASNSPQCTTPRSQQQAPSTEAQKKGADDFSRTAPRASMRKPAQPAAANTASSVQPATPVATAAPFKRNRLRLSDAKRGIQLIPGERCPHCERNFGLKAFDRHVEWCKEKALLASIKHTGTKTETNEAKERLEARTKYRAPCLKSKRMLNRDKYSGAASEENDNIDCAQSTGNNSKDIMGLSMSSSINSDRILTNTENTNGAAVYLNHNETRAADNAERDIDFRIDGEGMKTYGKIPKLREDRGCMLSLVPSHAKKSNETNDSRAPAIPPAGLNRKLPLRAAAAIATVGPKLTLLANRKQAAEYLVTGIAARPKCNPSDFTRDPNRQVVDNDDDGGDTLPVALHSGSLPPMMKLQQHRYPKHKEPIPAIKAAVGTPQMPRLQSISLGAASALVPVKRKRTTHVGNTMTMPFKPIPLQTLRAEGKGMPMAAVAAAFLGSSRHAVEYDDDEMGRELALDNDSQCTIKGDDDDDVQSDAYDESHYLTEQEDDNEFSAIKESSRALDTMRSESTRDKSFIVSGLPDKYDPFLSAKRQLEDLCSPTAPHSPTKDTTTPTTATPHHIALAASTPATPSAAMSSSFTASPLDAAALHHYNNTNTKNNNNENNTVTATRTTTQPKATSTTMSMSKSVSNFRRTSSLRGPRRSPMLAARPLFAQKPPSIQRGLSDEGPISTRPYLKPEEYDEMPVRSVCGNDFAITHSPRVVRRDTSQSNRRNQLKLNVGPTPPPATLDSTAETGAAAGAAASKYLSKTDSLAVFLSYEHEVAQPAPPAESAAAAPVLNSPPPQVPPLHSPIISKELKDKSNTLSKQNSSKCIKGVDETATDGLPLSQPKTPVLPPANVIKAPPDTPLRTKAHENNNKHAPVRLEPLGQSATETVAHAATKASPKAALPLPAVSPSGPINLNAIFNEKSEKSLAAYAKERLHSSSCEYIDPLLINKCDNLPMPLAPTSDTDSSPSDRQAAVGDGGADAANAPHKVFRCSASSAAAAVAGTPPSKLLPLSGGNYERHHSTAMSQQHAQRNSAEGRNLLKRKIRLGRNQFLYDTASPEADSSACSADDEANRSSVEYDDEQRQWPNNANNNHGNKSGPQHVRSEPNGGDEQQRRAPAPPQIPPLPIFDDFDFEEFLSSFTHDEEQFPLFKDCREFLLNRTSSKPRSTLTPNSNSFSYNNHTNNNNNNNIHNINSNRHCSSAPQTQPQHAANKSPPHNSDQQQQVSATPPSVFHTSQPHFQFPSIKPNFVPSSIMLLPRSTSDADSGDDRDGDARKRREIFISIETEQQSDEQLSACSPLRSLVGDARVMVELNGSDNKFTKFGDDEPLVPVAASSKSLRPGAATAPRGAYHLPNVQQNNAKNLMQKMQGDFRQRVEEAAFGGSGDKEVTPVAKPRTTLRLSTVDSHAQAAAALLYGCGDGAAARAAGGGDQCGTATCAVDSDELSSLEGYPISTQLSRRAAGTKLSADSAYGSLSRQRSSEVGTHRNFNPSSRPATATCATNTTATAKQNTASQHQSQQLPPQQVQQQQLSHSHKYKNHRGRHRTDSSSSDSENSLPPIVPAHGHFQEHYNNINSNKKTSSPGGGTNQSNHITGPNSNNNNEHSLTRRTQTNSNAHNKHNNNTSMEHNNSNNNNYESSASAGTNLSESNMSLNMKLSKFCHECGARFVIEHAKFCMDCGVRRIVL